MEGEETMQTIGITTPWIGADEAVRIAEWLESGKIDYIHLRHPDADVRQVERLILRIPQHLRRRLTLHGHFSIAQKLDVGGIHLNSRHPEPPAWTRAYPLRVSRSCHSLAELDECHGLDYAFLSPIFDSISKHGYSSAFPPESLPALAKALADAPCRIIALGGVTPDAFPMLRRLGFAGGAMLGYLWDMQRPDK